MEINQYDKTKHLEMIQEIITRMSDKSMAIKGWCITLISGLFIFSERNKDFRFYFILIIAMPLISFYILDTYYLILERKYRILYEEVRTDKKYSYEMAVNKEITFEDYCSVLKGVSQLWFYVPTIAVLTVIVLLYAFKI